MTREYWRLEIDKGNVVLRVYGAEDALRLSYAELREAKAATDGTGPKVVEIQGHTETPDRAEVTSFVEVESVISVSLTRMV